MEAINYLTDAEGRKKAIVIDLDELKRTGQTGHDIMMQLQEELEDLLDIALVKNEETVSWEEAEQQLREKGIID
ncbi:hypothetical protein [Spirosoma gilvum]